MQKENFYIDIISIFMKKIFEEVGHTFQCDVAAYYNVSEIQTFIPNYEITNCTSLMRIISMPAQMISGIYHVIIQKLSDFYNTNYSEY